MPLQAALSAFKDEVTTVYSNNGNTPAACATGIANAVMKWALQGVPMTQHPGSMQGVGGIDNISPGMGLAAAKPKLVADIAAGFKSRMNSSADAAEVFTSAHMSFFSKAKLMTVVSAEVPSSGPYSGKGEGGSDSPTAGKTLAAALPTYISTLTDIYANNSGSNTVEIYAEKLAAASFAFLSSIKVSTQDAGVAGSGGKSTGGSLS